MKNFKRMAAILLALCLVMGCAACSNSSSGDNPQTTAAPDSGKTDSGKTDDTKTTAAPDAGKTDPATTDAPSEPDPEPVEEKPDTKAYLDDEGVWRYTDTDEIVNLGGMLIELGQHFGGDEVEPTTASEIARAEYLDYIQETYNFTFKEVKLGSFGLMQDIINDFCTTGGPENYVFCLDNAWITAPMNKGLFYDLATLDCIDFSEEKWDYSTSYKMKKGDSIYGMRAMPAEPRGGLWFNKRIMRELGVDPESLYDMQASGNWTWTEFEELCKKLTKDLDGDGIIDVYAMSSFSGEAMNTVCASNGAQIIDYDENGKFINATNTEAFMEAYDWFHNMRQLYELFPEGELDVDYTWDYSYGYFIDGKVPLNVSEEYHAATYKKEMADDFGFVVFPKGPKVDDYNGYSTDNAYVIPAIYDEDRAWKIAFAYNLYTEPTPGYEDDDDWKTGYYPNFCDERAVDETLEILRDHQTACIYKLVPQVNNNNNYWWNIDVETAAERYETMKDEIQMLIDAVQD